MRVASTTGRWICSLQRAVHLQVPNLVSLVSFWQSDGVGFTSIQGQGRTNRDEMVSAVVINEFELRQVCIESLLSVCHIALFSERREHRERSKHCCGTKEG